ncbi:hypothetical protein OG968_35870 (plasmid) [Streptomyces althioticus]|uniref:hypothetical protein n=1 Tax=Streptomyces althioticus TaxID=83380 RepID=UPI002F90DBD1|nr:hypothetical protein OG968_35870 [Streptomyces althioticus]
MRVRKAPGLNQPDASSVKVTTARFDRFSRGISGEVRAVPGAETRARGGVRFGAYTQLMTNMPPVKRVAAVAR